MLRIFTFVGLYLVSTYFFAHASGYWGWFYFGMMVIFSVGVWDALAKKFFPNWPKRKEVKVEKNRDPFLLLSRCEHMMLSITEGDYQQQYTKVGSTWLRTELIETFTSEGNTYNLVVLTPDPHYGILRSTPMPKGEAKLVA